MKKLISVLLTASLIMGIAGCGNKTDAPADTPQTETEQGNEQAADAGAPAAGDAGTTFGIEPMAEPTTVNLG